MQRRLHNANFKRVQCVHTTDFPSGIRLPRISYGESITAYTYVRTHFTRARAIPGIPIPGYHYLRIHPVTRLRFGNRVPRAFNLEIITADRGARTVDLGRKHVHMHPINVRAGRTQSNRARTAPNCERSKINCAHERPCAQLIVDERTNVTLTNTCTRDRDQLRTNV